MAQMRDSRALVETTALQQCSVRGGFACGAGGTGPIEYLYDYQVLVESLQAEIKSRRRSLEPLNSYVAASETTTNAKSFCHTASKIRAAREEASRALHFINVEIFLSHMQLTSHVPPAGRAHGTLTRQHHYGVRVFESFTEFPCLSSRVRASAILRAGGSVVPLISVPDRSLVVSVDQVACMGITSAKMAWSAPPNLASEKRWP
ncbi:hypothetical protein FOPE_00289 [Fonsecaea pedrosoi]|nr:hypothetical protein FOPE_00289 [Fonsecaea pedrosoi]